MLLKRAEDESSLWERSGDQLGLESCVGYREYRTKRRQRMGRVGIRCITAPHSLPPSSHIRTAIGPSCDVLSLVGSDRDLSCSVGMTR